MAATDSPFVFDAGEDSFAERVLEASRSTPVLVDFWAGWCAPCRALAPILSEIVTQLRGAVLLAKVDTEREPRLALDHGVRSLPTVVLYKDARVVDQFMGLQPESAIRALLDRHVPRESDRIRARAAELERDGDIGAAVALLERAREEDPENHRLVPALAALLLERGDRTRARQLIRDLPPDERSEPEAAALSARIEFSLEAEDAPPLEALRGAVEAAPGDVEARYLLGIRHAAAGEYACALPHLLGVLERHRGFRDGAARRHMVAIFGILGSAHALVEEYRRKMARVMF